MVYLLIEKKLKITKTNYLEIIKKKRIVIKEEGVLLILSYIYSFCKIYNNCIIESHLFTSTLDIYK